MLDPYALPVGIPAHLAADAAAAGALSRLWFAHLGAADAPAPAMVGGALKPAGSPFQGLELGPTGAKLVRADVSRRVQRQGGRSEGALMSFCSRGYVQSAGPGAGAAAWAGHVGAHVLCHVL